MAWTDPIATAVTGAIAPASMWNAVRDNFALVQFHQIAKKSADEGPISSTTFQADNDLIAPVAANEHWLFQYTTRWVAATGADIKLRWTFPSSPVDFSVEAILRNAAGTVVGYSQSTTTSPADPGVAIFAPTTGSQGFMIPPITVEFFNGANAGNVGLEWAPNAAANLTCKAGSALWGVKLN